MRRDHATPRPWVYSGLIPASIGAPIGSVTIVAEVGGKSDSERAENARLIVRAVNSHDALVALARMIVEERTGPALIYEAARKALRAAGEEV